jgi:beta-phosphoglucomutase
MIALQAIVFDFDGVIANSEPLHLRAFQEALAPDGHELSAELYYARYLGYTDEEVFRVHAHDRGDELSGADLARLLSAKAARFAELASGGGVVFDGAAACIRSWSAEVTLAIASGALRHEIETILRETGLLGHFAVIVGADDVARGKPAPDPYLEALARLQRLRPGNAMVPGLCVAIEDSHWGLESAASAGLRTVAVTTSYQASELTAADMIVNDLRRLSLPLLEQLCGRAEGS